jgi:uncharacterized protein YndB with AHSA1/START domain
LSDWISGSDAATILEVSESTVYRSLVDPATRQEWWGDEGKGWRRKPLSRRRIFQVSRARAVELAGTDVHGEAPDGRGHGARDGG